MTMTRSRQPLVLQGYFRAERVRGTVPRAVAIQPVDQGDWAAKAPRPDLMPARTRGGAVQALRATVPDASWPGARRPDLLPGMGVPRGVAQPRASPGVSTAPIPAGQLRVISQGRPLEPGIRQAMESFFQADFSGVRVHEGPAAQAMGALAFTLGEGIHFAPGLYDPASREGVELLGHELTHVLQQRDGRVANPYGQGIAIVQDPALEEEADRMGQRIADQIGSRQGTRQPSMATGQRPRPAMPWALMRKAMLPPHPLKELKTPLPAVPPGAAARALAPAAAGAGVPAPAAVGVPAPPLRPAAAAIAAATAAGGPAVAAVWVPAPPPVVDAKAAVGRDPTQSIRPILGGIQIAGPAANGTLGVVIEDATNTIGILTAGHVVGAANTLIGQPNTAAVVAQVRTNGYPGNGVDIAFAPVSAGVTNSPLMIYGTLVDYEIDQTKDWPDANEAVTMQGAVSGAKNGNVVIQNANITFQNQALNGVSVANYASAAGDSGAPVMNIDGETVTLLGIHGGRVQITGVWYSWFTPIATIETLVPL